MKRPTRAIESNSWLHAGPSKNQTKDLRIKFCWCTAHLEHCWCCIDLHLQRPTGSYRLKKTDNAQGGGRTEFQNTKSVKNLCPSLPPAFYEKCIFFSFPIATLKTSTLDLKMNNKNASSALPEKVKELMVSQLWGLDKSKKETAFCNWWQISISHSQFPHRYVDILS